MGTLAKIRRLHLRDGHPIKETGVITAPSRLCTRHSPSRVAYPTQSHEMLFDAHARAFATFGGVPQRGICDYMKTAVDKVGALPQAPIQPGWDWSCLLCIC